MKTAVGFNQGQFGDLCMNVVACRAFKERNADWRLAFSINRKYLDLFPIFANNEFIDEIVVWDGYDNWPSERDKLILSERKFDRVFHPMESLRPDWQTQRHQTEEICLVHGLVPPSDLKVSLNQYFSIEDRKDTVIVCHRGATDGFKKDLSDERTSEICNLIRDKGLKPLFFQTGISGEQVETSEFFESVRTMLGAQALITIDSALNWIASGYNFPVLGLYNQNYYDQYGAQTSKNWQPINPKAIYLEADGVNNIPLDNIRESLTQLLW